MKINLAALESTSAQLALAQREIEMTAGAVQSSIGGQFSSIVGMNEAGVIHGRAITQDPASAQEILKKFAEQVSWASGLVAAEADSISQQDTSNSQGIEIADEGGWVGASGVSLPAQPSSQKYPLSFVPPVVIPGASLVQLANNFNTTRFDQLGQVAADWLTLATNISQVVKQLNSAASQLESEHDSDFTRNAAVRIREMAATGEQFAANASLMNSRAFNMMSKAPTAYIELPADVTAVQAIPDPIIQKTVEAAMLTKWQLKLQELVSSSLPDQQSLTDPPSSNGRGDNVEIGLESIAGTGVRYNTDKVVWPQEIQEAIQSGEIGPGSFGVADGELVALENIDQGLVDQVRQAVTDRNEALYGGGKLQEFINGGMQTLENTGTSAAGLDGIGSGAFNNGVNPGLGQSGAGAAASAGSGIGGLGAGAGSGAMGPLGALGGAGALGGTGNGSAASGSRGGIAGAGLGGARGAGAGAGLSGRGFGAAAGEGGSRVLGGSGDSASRAGAGAGSGAHGAGTGAGGSQNAHGRGAAGPMMAPGAAGRNQEKKKSGMIKAVTSRVEADKNRRDLLGDPPAALPGPIGDWARQ
ncbi:MAG: hypothetical protein ACTIB0_09170 [Corynebacterium casei]|uniref:hypothetical protein n=2 Tax=Corynebacterium casei TaxID=160386 RepID=UPI003F937C85